MRKYKNNKGYTLLELIVTLAIVGIVSSVVFSFFMTNLNSSNMVMDDTELQYQAQMAMNFITEKAMQGSGIAKVSDMDSTYGFTNSNNENSKTIRLIVFNAGEKYYCFYYNNKKLYFCENDVLSTTGIVEDKNILADNITGIIITPLDSSQTFKSTNSIKITISLQKDEEKFTISNIVYMRNKNN